MSSVEQLTIEDSEGNQGTLRKRLRTLAKSCREPIIAIIGYILIMWGGGRTWDLIRESILVTEEGKNTAIQMDLLQFVGFVIALSLALATASSWITNWALKEQGFRLESIHERETLKADVERHIQETEELRTDFKEIKSKSLALAEQLEITTKEMMRLYEENSHLKERNSKLTKSLTEESRQFLY